jgi:hypothetical protein
MPPLSGGTGAMRWIRSFTIAAALLTLTTPVFAAHNLRFYSVLKEGSSLTVDGGAPQHIDGETVWFTTLPTP